MMKLKSHLLVIAILSMAALSSCKKDETPQTEFDQINNWMFSYMDYFYLWTDELPEKGNTNIEPASYFNQLLSSKDRFSFIYEDYDELIALLQGVSLESGFEYKLYSDADGGSNIIMQLSYMKSNSPATSLGLQRGDIIDQINGTQLNLSNYQSLIGEINQPYTATYRRYNFETEAFNQMGTVNINPIVYAENPFLLDTIYEIEEKKIAYLIYTFFSSGDDNGSYDNQMDEIFQNFKSAGVQDLILDLRFNGGGSETSIRNLSSLMVKGATSSNLIFKKTFNEELQEDYLNHEDFGESYLNTHFLDKSQNIGNQLTSGQVYIITSNRSASASEVTINSLKPYMDVFIVGDTTVGKDVGSFTLTDDENEDNNWAIQPIVVKLVNSNDEDYPDGFVPNVVREDRDLVLKPLGDVEEPLLAIALAAIGVEPARLDFSPTGDQLHTIYSSLDSRAFQGKLLLEEISTKR